MQRDTKRQVAVVTVKDLQGYPIEEYGNRLRRTWGVGLKDVNNGAACSSSRRTSASVTRSRSVTGWSRFLTDALSSVIINND
ncbi:MAG: TPM domain-containing protein [Candidatus Sphingomonas colombiensis]|nr:TPM domain-containing protein [Sphingomonas sp.]WEK41926.1 MAG: TPM domain-containing protein [Sphingomonas sp.]